MATRKLPSGGKHARCIDHVPHSYTASGWLCVGTREPGRGAEMTAFADHVAAVRASHRTSPIDFGASHLVKVIRPDDIRPTLAECDWTSRALSCQIPVRTLVAPDVTPAAPVKAQKRPSPMAAAIDALAARTAARQAVAPISIVPEPVSDRPTCERCGQTFRKSGNGAEWHRLNRLDCAAAGRVAA